jgi:hypothetical protein
MLLPRQLLRLLLLLLFFFFFLLFRFESFGKPRNKRSNAADRTHKHRHKKIVADADSQGNYKLPKGFKVTTFMVWRRGGWYGLWICEKVL